MSYNVQSIPTTIVPSTNLGSRKKILPEYIKKIVDKYSVKILILQELFDKSLYSEVKKVLEEVLPYSTGLIGIKKEYANWTSCMDCSEMPIRLLNGGTCLFSEYKIVEKHQMVFRNSRNTCSLAAKGACLVVLSKGDKLLNVIGTHLQAYDGFSMEIRKMQYMELLMWLDKLFNKKVESPHYYAVSRENKFVMAGDFNTCCVNQKADFDIMLSQNRMSNFVRFDLTMLKDSMDPTYCTHTNDYCKLSNSEDFSHIYDYIFVGPEVKVVQPQRSVRDRLKKPVLVRRFYLHCIGTSKKKVYNPSDHFPIYAVLDM
ncbi:sphingomyelin phosphodiesterase [Theileria orientalis]|uniref:Sphingomyelin phosphodiesterase n=1 Tax=Theileria orientalis TaxID=68886 RepID=A0A976MAH9_THEOR|nr:sphingomyelin phosphodiesterase [Theileria orientalis]